MEKILAVGDVHSKTTLILPYVMQAIEEYEPTKIVFLGDYVDEWTANAEDIVSELSALIDFYEDNKDKLIMICGNHDYQYLTFGTCDGINYSVMDDIHDMLPKLNLQLSYAYKNYLFTHGGVISKWLERNVGDYDSPEDLSEKLNNLLPYTPKSLNDISMYRGGTTYPSPLWADMQDLKDDYDNLDFNQVVAHTDVRSITNISGRMLGMNKEDDKIVFCDTFSLAPSGRALGDGSLLLIEDDGTDVNLRKIESNINGRKYNSLAVDGWRYDITDLM